MIHTFAARGPKEALAPYDYTPNPLKSGDVEVKIEYCGLCHSDLHLIDGNWPVQYPLVPGHEIVGTITRLNHSSEHLKVGTRVGIGWQCQACLVCDSCLQGHEVHCPSRVRTCVDRPGGFADRIIVNEHFVYPIPPEIDPAEAAPLLCAGITTYSPLRTFHVAPPHSVAVIGIGGLGHVALQFAKAFGCEVTAISTTHDKEPEARKFGAHHFLLLDHLKKIQPSQFDFIISTVHAELEWDLLLQLLKPAGKLCCVGRPKTAMPISAGQLITGNRSLCGSNIGSRYQMREMLKFAARHRIRPQIEVMPMAQVNEAIAKLKRNAARYRIVLAR